MTVTIRPVQPNDRAAWLRMRCALWPQADPPHAEEVERFLRGAAREPLAVLVAEVAGVPKGFVELSIRPYAEGCRTDHVAYLEGWYVDEDVRGQGIGRALLAAAEAWGRDQACSELASDTDWDNTASARLHQALGFEEVGLIRCFRKNL